MNAGRIVEDRARWGDARLLGFTCRIADDTTLSVALPRIAAGGYGDVFGDLVAVPFIVHIGHVNLHADRSEIARLHELLGRALAATEPAGGA